MRSTIVAATNLFIAALLATLCGAGCATRSNQIPTEVGQHPGAFQTEITKTIGADYLLYLPPGYNDTDEKWPLLLFLHGWGERGADLSKVEIHGPPKLIAKEGKEFPFIVLSPQCPQDVFWNSDWQIETLNALLNDIETRYRIDTNRIYGTALSIGADGMGALAVAYPDRFAALALVCGGMDPEKAATVAHIPVWFFHGEKDNYYPIKNSRKMVEALKKAGGDVRLTAYPDAAHDAWTQTYDNDEVYEWLLSHTRADDEGAAD